MVEAALATGDDAVQNFDLVLVVDFGDSQYFLLGHINAVLGRKANCLVRAGAKRKLAKQSHDRRGAFVEMVGVD